MRPPHEHQQHCESSFSNVQPPSVERNAKRFWSNASDVVAAEREENKNFYREREKKQQFKLRKRWKQKTILRKRWKQKSKSGMI